MAKFKFGADGSAEAGNYQPVPDGEYVLGVTEVELVETSTNKPMLKLELAIDEGAYIGRKVWTNIVFNPKGDAGHGLTVQAIKAFGFEYDGELEIDTDDWKGRTCRARLETDSYEKDGKTKYKNIIPTAGYITDDAETKTAAKPVPSKPAAKPLPKPASKAGAVPF